MSRLCAAVCPPSHCCTAFPAGKDLQWWSKNKETAQAKADELKAVKEEERRIMLEELCVCRWCWWQAV